MGFHIIGDSDTILGYALAGVGGTAVDDPAPAPARLALQKALALADCQILLVTGTVAGILEAELSAHRMSGKAPYVVTVGELWESPTPPRSLERLVQQAVGLHLD